MKKIAIIGAGPAGIFTALFLKKYPLEIHLFEQNTDIGEKLKRTGGGRMNVANKHYDASCFFSNTPHEKDIFFTSSNTKKIESFMEFLGIEYIWEGKRAILKSQNAKQEVARLHNILKKSDNITLRLSTKIQSILPQNIGFLLNNESFDTVIIASGGMFRIGEESQKESIYKLIMDLGHSITSLSPSLSPFILKNHPLSCVSGIALPMQIYTKNNSPEANDGLITHFGFSGPVVLDFTAYWKKSEEAFINFLPAYSAKTFQEKIHTARNTKKTILSFLAEFVPKRLAEALLSILLLPSSLKLSELSKKDQKKIEDILFHYPLHNPTTLPYQGTWTTQGGVSLSEINMQTLESKKHKNLFFAGEVLDINGLCGGYHISFAMECAEKITTQITKDKYL